jgi:hypothetical protein
MSGANVRVLYVLGIYHSGTTLLGNLAGQLDGYFSVGELRTIWKKLALGDPRCGCGETLSACPDWSRVLRSALGERAEWPARARQIWQSQQEAVGEFHTWLKVPSLLRRRAGELPADGPVTRYAQALAGLYRSIAEETGTDVIVDSSKEPTDAALLLSVPGVDPSFAQIVRDPRGTVYSILRFRGGGQLAAESRWRESAYAALSWSAGNLAGTAVRRAADPARAMFLRYEDFVSRPHELMQALAQMAGKPATLAPSPEPGTVLMHPTHTVGGNNNRFRTGPVPLGEDVAWRSQWHPLDRKVVTAICAPLLHHYGYSISS